MREALCNFKEMSLAMMRLMDFKWGQINVIKVLKELCSEYAGRNRAFFNLLANQYLERHLSDLELGALRLEFGTKIVPFEGELLCHPIFGQNSQEVEYIYESAMRKVAKFRESSEYKVFVRSTRKGITKEFVDNEGSNLLIEKWNGGHYRFDNCSFWVCQELDYAIKEKLLYREKVSEKDMSELYSLMNYCQKTITSFLLMSNVVNLKSINDLERLVDSIVPDFRIIRTQEYHSGIKMRYLTKPKSAH